MATNRWRGDAPTVAQVNTITPASVTIGNIFTIKIGAVSQIETATIVGTIGPAGAGNATITVTAAGMTNSPKAVSVAVANNDTASQVAGKVRTALAADVDVSAWFTVSGSGAEVILTAITPAANDSTMNIASADGTCSGLTAQPTSVNTRMGFAGRSVSFTATAATVANVTAGLVDAIGDSGILEFQDVAAVDNETNVTLTANNPGKPFTQTSSAAQGAGSGGMSLTTTTSTSSSGPNDWVIGGNWSTGAVPAGTDDVLLDDSAVDILWNLPTNAVVNSWTRTGTFLGKIGLSYYDDIGYVQYRNPFVNVNTATVTLGEPGGGGPGQEQYDFQNHVVAVNVFSCGTPSQDGLPALQLRYSAATSTLNILQGQVGSAVTSGEISTWATVRVGNDGNLASDVTLTLGSGVTHSGTLSMYGGVTNSQASLTTVACEAGTLNLENSAAVTTLTATRSAQVNYLSNGTITTLNLFASTLDNSRDQRTKTITNCNVGRGATVSDPGAKITWSNGIVLQGGAGLPDVTIDVGDGRTLTIA